MKKSDRNKLLLLPKRYPCLDSFIVVLFFGTFFAVASIGAMISIQSLAIAYYALLDLNLLQSFLQIDFICLFCASILVIGSGSLGIISATQYSKSGLLTSMGFLIITFCFIDIYALGFRVKNLISSLDLSTALKIAISMDPQENIQFHFLQRRLSCCGVNNYYDWKSYHKLIPGSCCKNSTICEDNDPTLYTAGCLNEISKILENIYQTTVDTIIVLNVFLVIAIFSGYFYWYVLRQIKKSRKMSFVTFHNIAIRPRNQPKEPIFITDINQLSNQFGNEPRQTNYYYAYEPNENIDTNQKTQVENCTVQEEGNSPKEESNSPQEENNTAQAEDNAVQKEHNTAQEEANTAQEEVNAAQEEVNILQAEVNTAKEEGYSDSIHSCNGHQCTPKIITGSVTFQTN